MARDWDNKTRKQVLKQLNFKNNSNFLKHLVIKIKKQEGK